MKKRLLLGLAIMLLVSLGGVVGCGPATITFPDSNLEATIREAIGKPEGPILSSDLEALSSLDAAGRDITDLTGLEYCTNLAELSLEMNQISDISPLSSLTNLTELYLGVNQISDISPLSSLTNLTEVYLGANQITDILPLTLLTNLSELNLQDNPLSNISANVYIPQLETRGLEVSW